jgi:hypothetical protein
LRKKFAAIKTCYSVELRDINRNFFKEVVVREEALLFAYSRLEVT